MLGSSPEAGVPGTLRRTLKSRPGTPAPRRGHDGLLSRHGVKMASKGHNPSADVCSRVYWTGQGERATGDEGSGVAVSVPPSRESWSGS